MIRIINNDKETIELEYSFIKILQTNNTTLLYKKLFVNSEIYINEHRIKKENIIYINELSKNNDFINLTKKSFLMNEIFSSLENLPIINTHNIEKIKNIINEKYDINLLDTNDGDVSKIILLLLELVNDDYINEKTLDFILDKIFDENKLIIFDNISWLKFNMLSNKINSHNFIVLTTDFRNLKLNSLDQLETIVIFNEYIKFFEILDSNKLIDFLAIEFNKFFEKDNFLDEINDKNSEIYHFFMQKIHNIM